jgi:probable HAF family extracellular repeat protein
MNHRRRSPALILIGVVLGLVLLARPAIAQQEGPAGTLDSGAGAPKPVFSIIGLGTLGGKWSSASAINGRGHVVGSSETVDGQAQPFLSTEGQMIDLSPVDPPALAYIEATGIGDAGQIVGTATPKQVCIGGCAVLPFYWQDGTMSLLPLPDGYFIGIASGANASGQAVGWAMAQDGHRDAVIWRNREPFELRPPGSSSSMATAINARGQVVGHPFCTGPCEQRPFLWENGAFSELQNLRGQPQDINDAGHVVGYADSAQGGPAGTVAYLYRDGEMVDLGTLGGRRREAHALNNRGQVVGWAETDTGVRHAFIWQAGVMTDLNALLPNDSGWVLESASDINDAGQVVGTGLIAGRRQGFLADFATAARITPR